MEVATTGSIGHTRAEKASVNNLCDERGREPEGNGRKKEGKRKENGREVISGVQEQRESFLRKSTS